MPYTHPINSFLLETVKSWFAINAYIQQITGNLYPRLIYQQIDKSTKHPINNTQQFAQ